MRYIISAFALLLLAATPKPEAPIRGFAPDRWSGQRQIERQYDALLNKANLDTWMKRLTARPHHLGSAYGKENAEFIAAQFKSWGYDTAIERFDVLLPTPKTRILEMTAPETYRARLEEPALPEDKTSGQRDEQLPVYNAYSIDGDVTGELVYVNYGIPKDYEVLEERGVDVKGKIVIARYGGSWRGIKPKVAAEKGAIGCIIYSDPRDDGYYHGDVYPKGSWRNEWGAQRGSVADMPLYAGDPLTPGVGATKDAKRLSVKDAPTITKIPVLPISYGDALPLLRNLGGFTVPQEWRGALPITYHFGPGPARVHLKVEFDWKLVPAYNVIAKLRGTQYPDEWVIRGNHHDAWVNGAEDPISGMVALMEEARVVGELARRGIRPRRTIVYAAWDGEEQGLLGSTEWAETHADELKRKAVVYINTDGNGRGFFYAGASHTLEKFINEITREVIDPQTGRTVEERLRARRVVDAGNDERAELRSRPDLRVAPLGSGSDYTPFLQHLGIASMHIGYGGEDGGGSYHSAYDSYDHYTRFGDPGFQYGLALAQTGGRVMLRLANADVVPLDFAGFANTLGKFVDEVAKLPDTMRAETDERNRQIEERVLEAANDPVEKRVLPRPRPPVPHINVAPLRNALRSVEEAAKRYDTAIAELPSNAAPLNAHLRDMERGLTRDEGL
ncbi:MAG TPA: M28 family peptidase, partial [Thermoanaerobaculia bacterium]|nr:M28 family peptidase [Thermoanaerobaculia bacterium]